MTFSKWDQRMISLSQLVASWSKDPSTKVGAAIVDVKNRVVALGFNGLPRTVADDAAILANRDERLRRTIHAEENALLFATRSVENCTIYITHPPCARCAAKLIQAGVVRVVSARPLSAFSERWADDVKSSMAMFAEAGVSFEILEPMPGDG